MIYPQVVEGIYLRRPNRAFYGDSANRGITLVADVDPYSL